MIVWVASFPRSGNTFLRILLHRRYGLETSTVYDVDRVAERVGRSVVGYIDRSGSIDEMRSSEELHFVKTHSARHGAMSDEDRALCVVRDGRDALVSYARLRIEATGRDFDDELRLLVEEPRDRGSDFWDSGSWGANVLSWVNPVFAGTAVMSFDKLVADPLAVLDAAMTVVAPDVTIVNNAPAPSFEELRRHNADFFRRGEVGSHRTEMPADLAAAFWSRSENVLAMAALDQLLSFLPEM